MISGRRFKFNSHNFLHLYIISALLTLLLGVPFATVAGAAGYADNPQARHLIRSLVDEYEVEETQLRFWLSEARKQPDILESIARPAEKTKTWAEYRRIFIKTDRIAQGVEFWRANQDVLEQVESRYGVPSELIVAVIGVETRYGKFTGRHRVIDALATLAFDYPPRSEFFTRELREFFILVNEQQLNPLELTGSYAGAMGLGQFMPSSFRAYAVDFDADERIDIWGNRADAIASVGNYFRRHGWRPGGAVVVVAEAAGDHDTSIFSRELRPQLSVEQLRQRGLEPERPLPADLLALPMRLEGEGGAEFWLGLHNFYVITRYNHSHLYAMAVYQLSQEIRREMHVGNH